MKNVKEMVLGYDVAGKVAEILKNTVDSDAKVEEYIGLLSSIMSDSGSVECLSGTHQEVMQFVKDYMFEFDLNPVMVEDIFNMAYVEYNDYFIVSALFLVDEDGCLKSEFTTNRPSGFEYNYDGYVVFAKFTSKYSSILDFATRASFSSIDKSKKWIDWLEGLARELTIKQIPQSELEMAKQACRIGMNEVPITSSKKETEFENLLYCEFLSTLYGLYEVKNETRATEYYAHSMMVDLVYKYAESLGYDPDTVVDNLDEICDEDEILPIEYH